MPLEAQPAQLLHIHPFFSLLQLLKVVAPPQLQNFFGTSIYGSPRGRVNGGQKMASLGRLGGLGAKAKADPKQEEPLGRLGRAWAIAKLLAQNDFTRYAVFLLMHTRQPHCKCLLVPQGDHLYDL